MERAKAGANDQRSRPRDCTMLKAKNTKRWAFSLTATFLLLILCIGAFMSGSISVGAAVPIETPSTAIFLPFINKPTVPITGSVLIEDGFCCIGGVVGEPLDINVSFSASSRDGTVTEMHTHVASVCANEEIMAQSPSTWEPFRTSKTFTHTPPTNWSGFYVSVRYRDDVDNVSPIFCDDIAVEGLVPTPTARSH